MRTTAGHYFLLHHGRSPWRCSVRAERYAEVAETIADLNRRGARAARIVARHQTPLDPDGATDDPDQGELVAHFRATEFPLMDLFLPSGDAESLAQLYTEIFAMGVKAAFQELLPTHTRIDEPKASPY